MGHEGQHHRDADRADRHPFLRIRPRTGSTPDTLDAETPLVTSQIRPDSSRTWPLADGSARAAMR